MRICSLVLITLPMALSAQTPVDVKHYKIALELFDTTNVIAGTTEITYCSYDGTDEIVLDLANIDSDHLGMSVQAVTFEEQQAVFAHRNDSLIIGQRVNPGDCHRVSISYRGTPGDGLIIGENKFGDRTFFGDNWPNRAHHWFPCRDHPSDKATFEFLVTVPAHYQVVGSGRLMEETDLPGQRKLYHWATSVPLPTKVAVIGAARFAVQHLGEIRDVPVSTWVYPQNRDEGFFDFEIAWKVLDFFIERIGPYPYEKLANVQSKTRFGGMENASNVFYSERSVTGERRHESLIAHELAHQWFGNSATETDWPHLWLSEGFATYLTMLYIEHTQGADALRAGIAQMKRRVIQFAAQRKAPVVDTETTDYMQLLNANSYQKGALVLHMLRDTVGDRTFWEILRKYYQRYQFGNASTSDFQAVAEDVSKMDLDRFFEQWLYTAGHPTIAFDWQYEGGKLTISIQQLTGYLFQFPLHLTLSFANETALEQTLEVSERQGTFVLDVPSRPVSLSIDPEERMLIELRGGAKND